MHFHFFPPKMRPFLYDMPESVRKICAICSKAFYIFMKQKTQRICYARPAKTAAAKPAKSFAPILHLMQNFLRCGFAAGGAGQKKRSAKILRSARKKSQVIEGIGRLRRYPHGRSGFRRRSRAGNEGFPGIYAGFQRMFAPRIWNENYFAVNSPSRRYFWSCSWVMWPMSR